tara:strand:- start:1413 stop:2030 length:618 start_codon:yes stop_codon:yes gene_type:complete
VKTMTQQQPDNQTMNIGTTMNKSPSYQFPKPTRGEAGGGWTICPRFVNEVRETMQDMDECQDFVPDMEQTESVLMALEKMGVVAGEPSDAEGKPHGLTTSKESKPTELLEFQAMPGGIINHPEHGELYTALQMQSFAAGYLMRYEHGQAAVLNTGLAQAARAALFGIRELMGGVDCGVPEHEEAFKALERELDKLPDQAFGESAF